MLLTLMDGRARTGTELAILADVTPSTASVHLGRLRDVKLVRVSAQGRHKYYCLEGRAVARVLEGLSFLAAGTGKGFVPSTPVSLREARTCYDHIAGALAVQIHDHFLREGWLSATAGLAPSAYRITGDGRRKLIRLGIDLDATLALRRRFAYGCLDWSERRPHIAGALGAALLRHALTRGWVKRDLNSRALSVTTFGEREIFVRLGLKFSKTARTGENRFEAGPMSGRSKI
jgi:DNA-binding transcriptional ArsR family regulator